MNSVRRSFRHVLAPLLIILTGLMASAIASETALKRTALDRYVAAPDSAYDYSIARTLEGDGVTAFVVELTSQTWLTTKEVDRPLWKHWLTIIRPNSIQHDTALLFIGGGSNGKGAPDRFDRELGLVARETRSIVAQLGQVPNQPLTFVSDPEQEARVEDSMIAYAWHQYLKSGDTKWLPRLPMTKSAVRAMDAISAVLASERGGGLTVGKFVVAGGSKRGWTTWTTAAVDERVVAFMPIVIDLLNIIPSFEHHYRAYGFFAPAVGDYESQGIMDWQDTEEYASLLEIADPYAYRARYNQPKFLINATGDQFFLPDSSQFYWDDLPAEKHVRYVVNGDHGLDDTDALESLTAFYHAILEDHPRPRFDWRVDADGTIIVEPEDRPEAVKLWHASNPEARDFRKDIIGPAWTSRPLEPRADGSYRGIMPAPENGFTAYLIELTYPGPGRFPMKFTTEVRVTPNTLPFEKYQPKPIRR